MEERPLAAGRVMGSGDEAHHLLRGQLLLPGVPAHADDGRVAEQLFLQQFGLSPPSVGQIYGREAPSSSQP